MHTVLHESPRMQQVDLLDLAQNPSLTRMLTCNKTEQVPAVTGCGQKTAWQVQPWKQCERGLLLRWQPA